MTTRMIRLDDAYADKLEAFVADNSAYMQIVPDVNLECDEYFYERKQELQQIRDDVKSTKMEMLSEEQYEQEIEQFFTKLEK